MSVRVPVKPELLEWACERSGVDAAALTKKFPKIEEWLSGELHPTFKQTQDFARATRTPIGYLFLETPPAESVPIPDFRTVESARVRRPSPNLLDTIYLCQQRQDWYRQYAQIAGEEPIGFIGSASTESEVVPVAAEIRRTLNLNTNDLSAASDMEGAIRVILDKADEAGVLIMVSGVVGNNTHRPLDPGEFRGFALADSFAPLVFVNGADTKAGQMFTLAHELAHLWLGESGVSDMTTASQPRAAVEKWCNAVAAETLVPLKEFKVALSPDEDLWQATNRLARRFRVSTLVILRRMKDAGRLSAAEHAQAFEEESDRLRRIMRAKKEKGGGGDYYLTANRRLSERFARAVIASTWEGRSTFTEAFRLLGCRNVKTLESMGARYGMADYIAGGAV